MMNEPTKAMNTLSQVSHEVYLTLKNSLYPGAQDESIAMVIEYCKAANLDPLLKPVHIVPMWIVDKKTNVGATRDIIMPGINLYRIQASRSGCAGISEPEFGESVTEMIGDWETTYPKWCKVTVKRIVQGHIVDFSSNEFWKECYASKGGKEKNKSPNAMWSKRPFGQLAKCAEASALRKAFPEICAAPTAEEMEGKSLDIEDQALIHAQSKARGTSALKQAIGIEKTVLQENFVDASTGEITPVESELFLMVKGKMMSARSIEDLIDAVDLTRELEEEEKAAARKIYKEKSKEIEAGAK
jgi:phage recombination protein Bet